GDVRYGPAETGGVLDLVADVRAEHEQLFRHAAADHAGAAHPVFFGDHDPGAVVGCDAGGANAARTTADDEQIDVELSHINPARSRFSFGSDILAALLHLGAELAVDGFGKGLRPLVHVGHAELDGARLAREQLLAERRLVEGDEILQLLLGELVGVDLRHAFADFLLAAGEILGDDDGDIL